MKTTDNPGCLRVTIPLASTNIPLQPILHFGLAIANEVKKRGGRARCFKTVDFIIVEMCGISKAEVQRLVDCLGHSPSIEDAKFDVIVEERDAPEIDLEGNDVIPGEFTIQRLTKKFLFGLPDGAIIVGNSFLDGEPNFAARLEAGMDRSRIWKRAINSNAAQRICCVYWNPQDVMQIHGFDLDSSLDDDSGDPEIPTSRMWD